MYYTAVYMYVLQAADGSEEGKDESTEGGQGTERTGVGQRVQERRARARARQLAGQQAD